MTTNFLPPDYSSVHDDLIYTISDAHASDPVTYPNYKFIADIYVDGVQVARIKKFPLPDSLFGVFNISQTVRSYLSAVFNPDLVATSIVAQQLGLNEFNIPVQVKFGEEYGFTSFYNVLEDSERVFFNHYNKHNLGIVKHEITAFFNSIASNAPLVREVMFNSANYFVPYFSIDATPVDVNINTSDGGSHTFPFTTAADEMTLLNIAPQWLNQLVAGFITENTQWYTVEINDTVLTVNIICEAIYETFAIHFLNQYGGFDTKLFTKVSRHTVTVERKDFGVLNYTIDSGGIVSYYNENLVVNESAHVYSTQFTEKVLLNSNFLTDKEYIWLSDLIESPMVFIEISFIGEVLLDNIFLFPCKVTDNNYEKKKRVNDQLTNLTINIDYGKTFNSQYR